MLREGDNASITGQLSTDEFNRRAIHNPESQAGQSSRSPSKGQAYAHVSDKVSLQPQRDALLALRSLAVWIACMPSALHGVQKSQKMATNTSQVQVDTPTCGKDLSNHPQQEL
eukprot:2677923-Amphidinium_carterae.1